MSIGLILLAAGIHIACSLTVTLLAFVGRLRAVLKLRRQRRQEFEEQRARWRREVHRCRLAARP